MVEKPRVIKTWLTNNAYGFPRRGHRRRVKPRALLCLHISGNKRTAAMAPHKGTRAEVAYSNRRGSSGPSAHDYIARNGTIFRCIRTDYAGWSNGDVVAPDRSLRGIRDMLEFMGRGYNANEFFFREVELTGHPSGYDPTAKQLESVAWQLARDSLTTGLGIVPGKTVLLHAHVNGVDRRNCPFDRKRSAKLDALCTRARQIKRAMKGTTNEEPVPGPDPGEPSCEELYQEALGRIDNLREQRREWLEIADTVDQLLAPYLED